MKKAIITIVKRLILKENNSDEILHEIFDKAYTGIGEHLQYYRIGDYSKYVQGRDSQLKSTIDDAASTWGMNSIFKLNGFIPDLWDCSKRVNLKILREPGQLPSAKIEVIKFASGDKQQLELAIYFETEHLILIDSIGDKLLLSLPNTTGEEDATQTSFTDTFFLQLTNDLYFTEYNVLQ